MLALAGILKSCRRSLPFQAKATCNPISFDQCREFVIAFDKLYEQRDKTLYKHPNPMRTSPYSTVPLDYYGTNKEFFDSIQFPTGYLFPQDDNTGLIDRSFSGKDFLTTVSCFRTSQSQATELEISL